MKVLDCNKAINMQAKIFKSKKNDLKDWYGHGIGRELKD